MGYEPEEWYEIVQELRKELTKSETKYEKLLEKYCELWEENGELGIQNGLMWEALYPELALIPTAWDRLYEHIQKEDIINLKDKRENVLRVWWKK